MISRLAMLFLAVLLAVQAPAFAAPDRTGKADIGLNVSGAIPDDDGTDGTVYVGGSFAYGITNWLAVGAESGWMQFEESEAGVELEETAIPILGDIILRVPIDHAIQPYAIVGLGAIIWNVDDNLPNVEVEVDTAFAAKFGGGFDWFVNDNWIANFEFSYVTSDADGTVRNTVNGASLSAEGETDYWMVGGGVKYLFS